MKPNDRVKDTVGRLGPLWQDRMGLGHFTITHTFLELGGEDIAVTDARWNYLEARINWYLHIAARFTDEDIEEALVHEYVHILLCPEQSVVPAKHTDQMELATEMAARAVLAGWRDR